MDDHAGPYRDKPKTLAIDHLGQERTADEIIMTLARMLGWAVTPPWYVLERDLREKLRRLTLLGINSPGITGQRR